MTIIIPQKYMDYYKREPWLNNKSAFKKLRKNIKEGNVVIVDDETYRSINPNHPDTGHP